MLTRAVTGFFFLIIMLGCILWSKPAVSVLFLVIVVIGLFEFFVLTKPGFEKLLPLPVIIPGAIFYTGFALTLLFPDFFWFPSIAVISFFFVSMVLFDLFSNNTKFPNTFVSIAGLFYIALPFVILINFTVTPLSAYNYELLLGFFLILWSNDTFAYLTGKFFGKTKLWESVSPKKTWEGFAGGLVFSVAIGVILSFFFTFENILGLSDWIVISILISVFGTIGDLTESMLKRQAGVKDSGSFMPGHGGVLDRFDGVLLSAPAVIAYFYLKSLTISL